MENETLKLDEKLWEEKVAHSGSVILSLQEYVRESIVLFLGLARRYGEHKQLLKVIDDSIVSPDARAALRSQALEVLRPSTQLY